MKSLKSTLKNLFCLFFFSAVTSVANAQSKSSAQTGLPGPEFVVTEFFDAYQNRQHERVASFLHPDVIWLQPGSNKIAGVKKSREEVLAMGKQMAEISDRTLRLADVKILNANGNSVACLLLWKGTQTDGKTLDVQNVDIYTVENGQIVSVKVFSADLATEDKFWGK